MGNLQFKNSLTTNIKNDFQADSDKSNLEKYKNPSKKANFKYINPKPFDNQGILHIKMFQQLKQLKQTTVNINRKQHKQHHNTTTHENNENQKFKTAYNSINPNSFLYTSQRPKQNNPMNHARCSININANRNLDQLHKKFQSIKVKWNQFIKMKKRNFLSDYEIVYQIGQGSFGSVYKVKSIHTGIFRAAKKIFKHKLTQDLHQKLLEEITIMISLDHPNINKILEVYEQADFYVVLMQLCEGGQLFNKIVAKSLTQKTAAAIIKQIIRALMYIHSKNIIHRDIKAENMLFEKNTNLIKIIDFGISTKKATQKLTQRVGTPYYIAPEVLCKNYDEKCDLWSCGVILYMIVFGSPPFSGADENEIMRNILKSQLRFQGPKWTKLSPLGKDFIKGLLQKNPQYRFSTVQALNHPWLANIDDLYTRQLEYDCMQNLCRFHFKNKLEAVVLTYIVSQVLTSTQKLPLLKTFIDADTNSDGVLSFDEVKNLIKAKSPEMYKHLKVQTIQKLLKSIDLNNSNEIDFTQFLVATIRKGSITKNHLETAFAYFDIDRNGSISFAEIIQFLQNSKQSLSCLKQMFEKVDENHDGQISKEEFMKLMLSA